MKFIKKSLEIDEERRSKYKIRKISIHGGQSRKLRRKKRDNDEKITRT